MSTADKNDIALIGDEGAVRQVFDQRFIDRGILEVEVVDIFAELVSDRPCLLLDYLGL